MIFQYKKKKAAADSTDKRNSLMLKMVTSYSIFLLVILILFFWLYYATLNNACNSYNLQNESTFVSNVELFETDLKIMEVYSRQLLQNDTLRKAMMQENSNEIFSERGQEVRISLATDVYAEALLPITETFLYLPLTDYVLNPSYFITNDRFYNWIKKYPAKEKSIWKQYLTEEAYYYHFLSLDNFTPNHSKNYLMYIIDLNDLYYMDANGMVCFILERNDLSQLFDCLQLSDNSFLIALNQENESILTLGTEDYPDMNTISSLRFENGFTDLKRSGSSLTLGKYTSDNTGYVYYYTFPAFNAASSIRLQSLIFLLGFLLALMTGIFLVIFFSRRNVRPIIRLGQELQDAVEAQNQLQEVVDRQRPIICNSYARRLMTGSITSKEEVFFPDTRTVFAVPSFHIEKS